jgi:Holliday junction resolvasome RuvABC endonuclease subunit
MKGIAPASRVKPRKRRAPSLRILGLDFGLAYTGFAIAEVDIESGSITRVCDLGVITTESQRQIKQIRLTSDDLRRATIIAEAIGRKRDEAQVDVVAAEMVTSTRHIRPTFSFGVLVGITASLRRPVIQVLPHEVKLAATGRRDASKKDIIQWALRLTERDHVQWPTSARSNSRGLRIGNSFVQRSAEHQADALAVIQAAVRSDQFNLAAAFTNSRSRADI